MSEGENKSGIREGAKKWGFRGSYDEGVLGL
jgi:hypothetical protein